MPNNSVYKSPIESKLIGLVEPVIESLGYGLWDLEVTGGSSPIVRITLESANHDDQIGIDDCSTVHKELNPMFDVWDPIEGAYTLEVSSPGERANLRLMRHFELARGGKLRFQTTEPIPMPAPAKPRKNWEGILKELDPVEGFLELEDEMGSHKIKFSQIRSAQWLRDWTMAVAKPTKMKREIIE